MQGWFIGLVLLVIGIGNLWQVRTMSPKVEGLRRRSRQTAAVVVAHEYRTLGAGDLPSRYPIVQFRTTDGQLVTAKTDFGGSFVPRVGEQVKVVYDPDNPETAYLFPKVRTFALVLFAIVGSLLIVAGVIVLVTQLVA